METVTTCPLGFKVIPDTEGLYYASQSGEIWSSPKSGGSQSHDGKILKPQYSKDKYQQVTINIAGKRMTKTVHRLVAITFVDNKDGKPQVNHIDCDKNNNSVENLEWCTAKENTNHAIKNGLISFGELAQKRKVEVTRKLLIEDIHDILRLRFKGKMSYFKIADIKGVAYTTIGKICRGERYKIEVEEYFRGA